MALNRKSAVIGSALFLPDRCKDKSLEEALYEIAQEAIRDAGLTMDEVDGIVVGSNDQFDGRAISVMMASGSVGGVDRDILSTPSSGEHAFVLGVLRVASGQFETQLVISWSLTEASSLSEAQRLGADPYFHRRLPLDEGSAFALQASVIGAAWPQAHDLATPILIKNRGNGAKAYPGAAGAKVDRQSVDSSRPKRWPLREAMLPPPAAGIVALVIASDAHIEERGIKNPAWIRGMGWATETGFLGDRDLKSAPALDAAAERAYEEAGITDPRKALDLVELTDATPYQELLVYDRLGLSSPDKWQSDVNGGSFSADGGLPVNLSGGVAAYNPVFCTGLIRIAEAANQIRGKAGAHQKNGAKLALAHAASGFAMQYQTVLVFGAERGE